MQRKFVPAIDKMEILKGQFFLRPVLYPCNVQRIDWMCLTFDTQLKICKTFISDLNLYNYIQSVLQI